MALVEPLKGDMVIQADEIQFLLGEYERRIISDGYLQVGYDSPGHEAQRFNFAVKAQSSRNIWPDSCLNSKVE
ncbi:hypothetical protein ACFL27_06795 [candidate division CSSED10-310 bacterium]|uniref:Uncharacterized protein n=1 Tax=candidate division CSSED10-310 bacterium TaxID=2855610 RepID=A0ABV6YUP7_UNCC1